MFTSRLPLTHRLKHIGERLLRIRNPPAVATDLLGVRVGRLLGNEVLVEVGGVEPVAAVPVVDHGDQAQRRGRPFVLVALGALSVTNGAA